MEREGDMGSRRFSEGSRTCISYLNLKALGKQRRHTKTDRVFLIAIDCLSLPMTYTGCSKRERQVERTRLQMVTVEVDAPVKNQESAP